MPYRTRLPTVFVRAVFGDRSKTSLVALTVEGKEVQMTTETARLLARAVMGVAAEADIDTTLHSYMESILQWEQPLADSFIARLIEHRDQLRKVAEEAPEP